MQLDFEPNFRLGLDTFMGHQYEHFFYKTLILFLCNKKELYKKFSGQTTARSSEHTKFDSLLTQQNTVFFRLLFACHQGKKQ